MALSTQILSEVQGSAARIIQKARIAAEAQSQQLAQERQDAKLRAIARHAEQLKQEAKDERAKAGRTQAALKGIENLFALASIPELPLLCDTRLSQLPPGGFMFYLAQDDQEYVAVGLYPDLIMVEVGGATSQYETSIRLERGGDDEALREKISEIVSIRRSRPLEIVRVFDRPGDNGDLFDLAFQVLVDASKEHRLHLYLKDASGRNMH